MGEGGWAQNGKNFCLLCADLACQRPQAFCLVTHLCADHADLEPDLRQTLEPTFSLWYSSTQSTLFSQRRNFPTLLSGFHDSAKGCHEHKNKLRSTRSLPTKERGPPQACYHTLVAHIVSDDLHMASHIDGTS